MYLNLKETTLFPEGTGIEFEYFKTTCMYVCQEMQNAVETRRILQSSFETNVKLRCDIDIIYPTLTSDSWNLQRETIKGDFFQR